MSDPNNPTTPPVTIPTINPPDPAQILNSNVALQQLNQTILDANNYTTIFNNLQTTAGTLLLNIQTGLTSVSDAFKTGTPLTKAHADAFNVLSTAVFGTTKAFNLLTDNTGLVNFSTQIENLASKAKTIDEVSKLASQAGIKIPLIGSLADLKNALVAGAKAMASPADEALKYQNALFGAAGASGQLNELLKLSGDRLTNVDNVTKAYSEKLLAMSSATGVAQNQLAKFQIELATNVPGALTKTIGGLGDGSVSVDEFQAAVQLAHGTGRTFEDVMSGLTSAFQKYGLEGDKALAFTARASELSSQFGIRLQDTRGFMDEMANSFKFLGDNAEGTAQIFADLFKGLRDGAKIGAEPAIEIIKGVQDSLANLSIAQKAFLSSRTGGPGGLLGAVQIEQDLAAGKTEEVFNRLRAALQQQFGGRIVTRDDVRTQADAAVFTRQRLLLQSGAFGNIAKTDTQAADLLKALSTPAGDKLASTQKLLTDTVKVGSDRESQIHTALIDANKSLDTMVIQGGITAFGIMRQVTAGAGVQDRLTAQLSENARAAGQQALGKITGQDNTVATTTAAIKGVGDSFSLIGSTAKNMIGQITKTISEPDNSVATSRAQYNKFFSDQVDQISTTKSSQVATAVRSATTGTAPGQATTYAQPNILPAQQTTTTTPQPMIIQVVGVCPDCHKKFVQNPQKTAINNASNPGY